MRACASSTPQPWWPCQWPFTSWPTWARKVIKVETHTLFRTEAARLLYADNEPGDEPWNRDGSFNTLQRSKLGVTLNLKVAEGVQAFKELTRISDVVVENNRAGTMDRLGLSYEELKKEKPDLIYVSNTGFGHTGPWRTYAGIGRMFELTCGPQPVHRLPGRRTPSGGQVLLRPARGLDRRIRHSGRAPLPPEDG